MDLTMTYGILIYPTAALLLIVFVYLEHVVSHRRVAFLLFSVIITVLFGLFFSGFGKAYYALCSRDLELEFLVTDADTAERIANASIEIVAEGHQENHRPQKFATLMTDNAGIAKCVREMNSCEDIVKPFHKTVTLVDLTWAVVGTKAEDYEPVEEMLLHFAPKTKNETERNSAGRKIQRVGFTIPMRKLAQN